MTLDPSYLTYPKRARGMDQTLYPWSNLFERAPVSWVGGKGVAVSFVISLEWFPITPADKPFRAPGHMQTPYPDYRHYTSREYGTRIGFYRMLDAFAAVGASVGVAMNGAIAERYPSIVRDIVSAGHEIIAHSTDMNGTIATGLAEDEESVLILRALNMIESVAGRRPRGWLSIARSQSWNTLRLLAEAGLGYQCDWVNDELPYRMETASGPITAFPLNHELSDRQIITVQQQSAESFAVQIEDAVEWLLAESERFGGRLLPIHLTPYVMGLPYRIGALERLLTSLKSQSVWIAPPGEIIASMPDGVLAANSEV